MRAVRLNATARGLMVAALALGSALILAPATQTQAAAGCAVTYTVPNQWNSTPTRGGFQIDLSITNSGTTTINGWTLTWTFANGQTIQQLWNAAFTQSGANITVSSNQTWNATIAPGGTLSGVGFTGAWSGSNGIPTSFTVNDVVCGGVGTATATPTPVVVVTGTSTAVVATNTPTRTPTTVVGATSTSTPTRTSTPVVGATSTSTPTRTSTPVVSATAYTADIWVQLTQPGRFPTTLGFIVDTSRNGWGGLLRPTAASTSTAVETFVAQSRVDRRPHRGAWCNQNGAGIGERPVASPAGFPNSHVDAFVWVKPPGESDGSSTAIANNEGKGFDRMCDPTFNAPALKGQLTNALPNAPLAGHWFPAQFVQLVQNAFPAIL